jgi:hypothetical protein
MSGDADAVPQLADGLPGDPKPDAVPVRGDAVPERRRERDGDAVSAGRDPVPQRFADAMRVRRERNGLSRVRHALPAVPDAVSGSADTVPAVPDAVPADADGVSGDGHRVRAATGGDDV